MAHTVLPFLLAAFFVPGGPHSSYVSDASYRSYGTYESFSTAPILGQASSSSAAEPSEQRKMRNDLQALLEQANAAFRQANAISDTDQARSLYERAVLLYEKVIGEAGLQNAKLYYNLGNAYLLKEDLGRAILNYRRAEQLDGADLNIRKNLAFARSRRIDRVEVGTERRVLETLFFWHYDLSLRTRFLLACLFFATLCLALTAMVWRGRGPLPSTVAAICVVVLLALVFSMAVEARHRVDVRFGVITAGEVVARQGDGPNYPASFKEPLHAGTEFELLERRPGWLHIRLSDGTDAWVPENMAGIV